jgi:hypothetical protein
MPQRFVKSTLWRGALMVIVLLAAWPSGVGADDTPIPPETHWTPTPQRQAPLTAASSPNSC